MTPLLQKLSLLPGKLSWIVVAFVYLCCLLLLALTLGYEYVGGIQYLDVQ